mmetsp:Transcript_21302/g.50178  ORF Transcript_21302/g.50178 Transcript_21302/m.50178 type:complete len:385 (+) Transcript_21302:152-1306(+)
MASTHMSTSSASRSSRGQGLGARRRPLPPAPEAPPAARGRGRCGGHHSSRGRRLAGLVCGRVQCATLVRLSRAGVAVSACLRRRGARDGRPSAADQVPVRGAGGGAGLRADVAVSAVLRIHGARDGPPYAVIHVCKEVFLLGRGPHGHHLGEIPAVPRREADHGAANGRQMPTATGDRAERQQHGPEVPVDTEILAVVCVHSGNRLAALHPELICDLLPRCHLLSPCGGACVVDRCEEVLVCTHQRLLRDVLTRAPWGNVTPFRRLVAIASAAQLRVSMEQRSAGERAATARPLTRLACTYSNPTLVIAVLNDVHAVGDRLVPQQVAKQFHHGDVQAVSLALPLISNICDRLDLSLVEFVDAFDLARQVLESTRTAGDSIDHLL